MTNGQSAAAATPAIWTDLGWSIEPEWATRRPDDQVFVPVAVHLMVADVPDSLRTLATLRPNHYAPAREALLDIWDAPQITALLGHAGGVNRILKPHGIRLAVVRVNHCEYSPARLRSDRAERDSIYMAGVTHVVEAAPGDEYLRTLAALGRHATDDAEALDLYVYWSISEGVTAGTDFGSAWGFGVSRSRGGPAVWVDIACALSPGRAVSLRERMRQAGRPFVEALFARGLPMFASEEGGCRLLAHEVGHALSLPHVAGAHGLMSLRGNGVDLTPQEMVRAHRKAREYFPRSNPTSGT